MSIEHMSSLEQVGVVAALAALDVEHPDTERADLLTITTLERLNPRTPRRRPGSPTPSTPCTGRPWSRPAPPPATPDGRCARRWVWPRGTAHCGSRHVGLAATLVLELSGVLRALERGDTSEWRVTIIARVTTQLSVGQRALIDAAIATSCPAGAMPAPNAKSAPGAHRV